MRKRTDGACVARVGVAVVLALVAGSVAHAQTRINECNSSIVISQLPAIGIVGQTSTITLTVSSDDSRDNTPPSGNPVPQVFDKAMYTGDCVQPPGLPCTPDPMATVMYQGNVGGTCMGMGGTAVVANPMGNGVVEFDFVPDLSLLIPANMTPISCTITFDVTYSASGVYAVQAMTAGICQNGLGSNSQTTVTSVLNAVGEPELNVMKECTGTADAMGQYPYTVTLENTGTEALSNCFLTDPGAVCGALSATTLAPTEMATATCTSPSSTNTVTATCDFDVGMGPEQIVRESEPAECLVPELSVTKECAGDADAMGQFPYEVTLENTGTSTLSNCFLTDPGAVCDALSATTLAPTETATTTCTSPDLTNTVTATCEYDSGMGTEQIVRESEPAMCVPTLGELGLIALAVLLALGSWRILRRQNALSPG